MKKKLLFILLIYFNAVSAQDYQIHSVSVNTNQYDEFAGCLYNNEFIFCSNKKDKIFNNYVSKEGLPFINIYSSGLNKSTSKKINFHDGTIGNIGPFCFTPDRKQIYYTKNITKDILGIFTATIEAGKAKNETSFTFNSTEYSTGHPCISKDGKSIYFISNKPGGFGGTDIYVSHLENNSWSAPVNLGNEINSETNEMFPFIDESEKLYFSSSKNSIGGLDIFFSEYKNGKWDKPLPLNPPINSDKDDFAYITEGSGDKGYFSSNRKGTDDIFQFTLDFPKLEKCDSLKKYSECFVFYETAAMEIDTMPLIYQWDMGDGTKIRGLEADHCFKGPGTYQIKLNVVDTITGEVFYNQAEYDFVLEGIKQPYITVPDTAVINSPISFNGEKSNIPGYSSYSFFWDFGNGKRSTGSIIKNEYKEPGNYIVKLGVTAKDQSGNLKTFCTCKTLTIAEKENENKISFQKKKNIKDPKKKPDDKDLLYKVQLLTSEHAITLDNKVFDNIPKKYSIEENYIEDDKEYTYTVGNEKSLAQTFPIYKEIVNEGYNEATVKKFKSEIISLDNIETATARQLQNKTIRIEKALFNTNEYDLSENTKNDLRKLLPVLKSNKKLKVLISAHTDNVGDEKYNMELSKKRAEAIVNFLVNEGIDAGRCMAKGCGKSMPIASNNTEEGRQLNRRVEITLR